VDDVELRLELDKTELLVVELREDVLLVELAGRLELDCEEDKELEAPRIELDDKIEDVELTLELDLIYEEMLGDWLKEGD
jgi:hypothetical protein